MSKKTSIRDLKAQRNKRLSSLGKNNKNLEPIHESIDEDADKVRVSIERLDSGSKRSRSSKHSKTVNTANKKIDSSGSRSKNSHRQQSPSGRQQRLAKLGNAANKATAS